MLTSYKKRPGKIIVQRAIYSTITRSVFVGLCGPDILEYLDKIEYKRFKKVILYEQDTKVYLKIKKKLTSIHSNVELYNDDINNNLGKTEAFYDLDYCCNFKSIRKYMLKIAKIKEFSITVSVRKYSFPYKAFESYLGHSYFRHYTYRDGMPMTIISVSKRLWS
jgi:hypothetical protein